MHDTLGHYFAKVMLTDSQNSFTVSFNGKFVINSLLNILPHLTNVDTKLRVILMSGTRELDTFTVINKKSQGNEATHFR